MYIIDEGNPAQFPILMLHGLGANAQSWHFQIPALAGGGFRAVAPDLPGFGRSTFSGKEWSLDRVCREVVNLLNERNISSCGLLGISMGGVIGLKLAADYPQIFQMSILVNTFAVLRPKRWNETWYFLRRGLRAFLVSPRSQAKLVAKRIFPEEEKKLFRKMLEESIQQANPVVYRKAMLSLALFDGTRLAKRISNPVLVVSGERDTTVPLALQMNLVSLLPNAAHVIIKNAGHALPIDQPALFNRLMLAFYSNPSEIVRAYASKSVNGCLQEKF